MSAAWEQLPLAAVLLRQDADGVVRIAALNRCARQLLQAQGLQPGQAAEPLLSCLGAEPQTCLAQPGGLQWDTQLQGGGAEPRWLRLVLEPLREPGETRSWQLLLLDQTEQQRRLQALQSSLEDSRRLLDSVPVVIAIASLDGDDPSINAVNAEFERAFGYSLSQLPRVSDWGRLAYPDPQYRQGVFARWDAAVEQARRDQSAVAGMEFVVTTAWGEQRSVLFSARVVGSELLVTLLDVTDRRLAETELRNAREQLAQTALEITEAIPVGTYTMVLRPGSELASFSFMSERFLQLTGLKRHEALADPLKAFACVHPDDYDAWVQLNARVFAQKLPFFGQTRVVVDGQVRWITAESVPRDLPDGSTVWEGVLIDVTDRIVAQQQLERSRADLERILNNIPVAIAINTATPGDQSITFLNDHSCRTLGYSQADIPKVSDWARLAYPDPAYRDEVFRDWNAAMDRALPRQGSVQQAEYRVCRKDGRSLTMLISAVVLDEMVLVALIDVTRSRQAERELLEALRRERAKEERLRKDIEDKLRVSLTASAVAHEISQPLSTILVNSKLALREIGGEHPELDVFRCLLQPLVQEAERMHLITDRIRMLLRNVDTAHESLDLRDVVQSAQLQLQPALHAAGLTLDCRLPQDLCRLQGDAVQLQLALLNLLRNSLEALRKAIPRSPNYA